MAPRKTPTTGRAPVPSKGSMEQLRQAAAGCRACDLWRNATQTVFGEGPRRASIMLIGEQPGNSEDLEGHPFVGPAGKLLRRSLEQAGIDEGQIYVTNAVKHFKWEPRGKRRIHKKPSAAERAACRPWLEAEIAALHPQVIVCLGATAAQSVVGPKVRVSQQRAEPLESELAPVVVATVHPSSLLRITDDDERHREMDRFVDDLKKIKRFAEARKPEARGRSRRPEAVDGD